MWMFRKEQGRMLSDMADRAQEAMWQEAEEYDRDDEGARDTVEEMSKSSTATLVLSGAEMDMMQARDLMAQIVRAELDHWIPGASQRLLYRASRALDISTAAIHSFHVPECGTTRGSHAVVADWIADIHVVRCVVCGRVYRV